MILLYGIDWNQLDYRELISKKQYYAFIIIQSSNLTRKQDRAMIVDITQKFHATLQQLQPHSQALSSQEQSSPSSPLKMPIESQLCNKQAEGVLNSLHKIMQVMNENRENYFSNAAYSYSAFTDQQRSDFDKEMKEFLDNCACKISEFQEVVGKIRFRNKTEQEHFRNLALCLYQHLKKTTKLFGEFMEFNENRKRKLQAMIGTQAKPEIKRERAKQTMHISRKATLVDEQLEQESQTIFKEKMSEHRKIEDTKKTLEKINKVLDEMSNKVLEQELLTSSFMEIGEVGLFHIDRGNKNLVQANELSKDTGKYWTIYFLSLALSLLLLDYIKS